MAYEPLPAPRLIRLCRDLVESSDYFSSGRSLGFPYWKSTAVAVIAPEAHRPYQVTFEGRYTAKTL